MGGLTGQDKEETIDAEAETGSARRPYAETQLVEGGKTLILSLLQPAIDKDKDMADVKAVVPGISATRSVDRAVSRREPELD